MALLSAVLVLLVSACDTSDPGTKEQSPADTTWAFLRAPQFIDFGTGENRRTITGSFTLPDNLEDYESIDMIVRLECPANGCDPWDRFASIRIRHDDGPIEIGRYITPYGIGCGWTFDVSDYRSYLTGEVELESFIDTWVSTGWLVSVAFAFHRGEPAHREIRVENLWMDENVVYGDPDRPPDQPATEATIDPEAARVLVRVWMTGHGQGNTGNAAEFYRAEHSLIVNGVPRVSHLLWRDDCASNPCANQKGSWQYSRAGWCPGAEVKPLDIDLTAQVTPGATATIEYRLDSYENLCRPDNPSCVSGQTCRLCEYDGGAHTEPHYKMSLQLITHY